MAAAPSPSAARSPRRWYHPRPLLYRLVLIAAIVYAIVCGYLYAMQTHILYVGINYPISTAEGIREAGAAGLVPWDRTTPGTPSPQGFVTPDFAAPTPRGTIVLFHGNGEFAWIRSEVAAALKQRGFRVFLYEYPGYGGRPGVPSEKVIVTEARALIRSLDAAGFGPVYVWGISLGSGVAASVCADPTLPVHGLALTTPWDNLANVGLQIYPYIPVRLLLSDRYDSVANLQHFAHPICIIRCEDDTIIPRALTLHLIEGLPGPKKIIVQPGDHNDWPASPNLSWWDDTLDFIAPR